LRLDGKAFHTFTRGCKKPFDQDLIDAMTTTARYLGDNIQGARLVYTQSDEISILVCDYDRRESQAWFDNQVQKMCSVAASMATAIFNDVYESNELAMFDCRAFNIPKEDVSNYFLWRYQDWARNNVAMVAQSMFSHKVLQSKNIVELEKMIRANGWHWESYPLSWSYGTFYCPSKYNHENKTKYFSVDLRRNRDWITQIVDWINTEA